MDTVWDLREAVKYEKAMEKHLDDSVKQWQDVIDTFNTDTSNVTNSGFEWKVRYECQKQCNISLQKNIMRMRAELRMLRCGVEYSPFKDDGSETIGELRTRIRQLKIEKCSMKSLRDMYERQLDTESIAYYRTCAELDLLTKDVFNSHASRIRDLEKADHDLITSLQTSKRGKRRNLKPISKVVPTRIDNKTPLVRSRVRRGNTSYTNMFLAQRGLAGGVQEESERHLVAPPETSVVGETEEEYSY